MYITYLHSISALLVIHSSTMGGMPYPGGNVLGSTRGEMSGRRGMVLGANGVGSGMANAWNGKHLLTGMAKIKLWLVMI